MASRQRSMADLASITSYVYDYDVSDWLFFTRRLRISASVGIQGATRPARGRPATATTVPTG